MPTDKEMHKWSSCLNEKIAALQKLVDAEEAEGADIKVLELLKKAYPKDEFRVVGKNTGANKYRDNEGLS